MNRIERHYEPSDDALGCRTFSHKGSAIFTVCAVVILTATWTPSVLSDVQVDEYVGPMELVDPTNVPTDEPVATVHRNIRYHRGGEIKNLNKQSSVRLSSTTFNRPCSLP